MSIFQGTVSKSIKFAGVGLHSGRLINLGVHPLPPHSGILFQRTDVPGSAPILAHSDYVQATELCTTIGSNDLRVSTIEHLMAAFFGLGIDNALVTVDAEEVPILDGSAAPFVDKLGEAGVQIQPAKRRIFAIAEPFEVTHKDQYVRFEPSSSSLAEQEKNPTLEFECIIDFPSKVIGRQALTLKLESSAFMKICEARTFCHVDNVTAMREKGLALGGSLDNAVVINDERVLNVDGLRVPDEFVRHKLLDCIGDLGLLGGRLSGKIFLYKAGHGLHARFVKKAIEIYTEKMTTSFRSNTDVSLGLAAFPIHKIQK